MLQYFKWADYLLLSENEIIVAPNHTIFLKYKNYVTDFT